MKTFLTTSFLILFLFSFSWAQDLEINCPENRIYDECLNTGNNALFLEEDAIITGGCPPYNVVFTPNELNPLNNCDNVIWSYNWEVTDDCGEIVSCTRTNQLVWQIVAGYYPSQPDDEVFEITYEYYQEFGYSNVGLDVWYTYNPGSYQCSTFGTQFSSDGGFENTVSVNYDDPEYYSIVTRLIFPTSPCNDNLGVPVTHVIYIHTPCEGILGCTDENAYNYDPLVECENGSCIYSGCFNELACNYNSIASVDDGSCILPDGCTDENANNYNSSYLCNDGSCYYTMQGLVYFDENENGVFDGIDYGLPFQEITSSDDVIYLTNDEGIFYVNVTIESTSFTISSNESFPFNTTANPQTIINGINNSSNDYTLNFGISSEEPDFAICLDFYPPGSGYPCDDWVNHNLCYRNMGNVPIDGILEVEFDPLFQNFQEVTPIDSVVGNTIYMSFENLLPGQMYFYDVSFHTPNFESIGEFLTSTGRVYGFYEGEQVAYGESVLVQEMTCAYDPNDKQVFPAGYEIPHFVLPETRLEYLVRFQNTGNAPATNVLVTDTIDSTLDLNTFELVANSHSVITTIKTEERVIEFLFENIMLPDSTVNEPESHGLISYKLTPYSDLDFETEINNTAFIYFDNNPPIVTNTTWTTIYDCNNGLAAFNISDSEICSGGEISFENIQDYVEDYNWYINDDAFSIEQTFANIFEDVNQYVIRLEVSNPLCEASDSTTVLINPLPEINFTGDLDLCIGESTMLTASGGDSYDWNGLGTNSELEISPTETTTYEVTVTNSSDCSATDSITVFVNPLPTAEITADQITLTAIEATIYQWYLNGNPIDGANFQSYVALENGNYAVEVTNEFDCTSLSDEIIISVVGMDELSNPNIQLFPNPMQEYSVLYFGESGVNYQVTLFDAAGRLIRNYGVVVDGQLEIQRKGLSAGNYLVEVVDLKGGEKFGLQLVVE